jgi:hypothetical protein
MTSIETIIDRQIRRWELQKSLEEAHHGLARSIHLPKPLITVSRQRGSHGTLIAERIAYRFNYTLLHKDIIDRICETSGYKRRIVESLDEHTRSQMELWFESIVTGKLVDLNDYARHLLEIIFSISRLGGIVVVGRAANFIIGPRRGLHVRIVGSSEMRISNLVEEQKLTVADARKEIEKSDHERAEFVHRLVNKSIDDPRHYDLIINSDWISIDQSVSLIANAAMEKFELLTRENDA